MPETDVRRRRRVHENPNSMIEMNSGHPMHRETVHRLARRALFSFILTFVLARVFVFLIMAKEMPNLYFFMHGTHVHHLNYGIFLMSAVCGYSVFRRPTGRAAEITALLYGVAMGLTFDEFGMWLHLGGSYWQRASVDAVIVVSAVFGLFAFARSLEKLEARHFRMFAVLLVVLAGFAAVLYLAGNHLADVAAPTLQQLESDSSP
jgi:ABC-type thiamin/hydroxymethylpyrimidine transport system permease subunit